MFLALAFILIALALFFVMPPLRGRGQATRHDQHQANLQATRERLHDIEKEVDNDLIASEELDSIRQEAETTLLLEMSDGKPGETREKSALFHNFWTAVIVVCIPLFAFLVYLSVGTPTALLNNTAGEPEQQAQQLEQLISQLEERLTENPDDEEGWLVLAQTNMVMQRFDQGVEAMENLYRLKGDTPDVLSRYADALTMANEGRFTDKAKQLIKKALFLDANHVHTLWLAGAQAYQAEQFDQAIDYFEKAKANTDDAQNIAQIDELIKAARERGNVQQNNQPSTEITSINVKVDIDESLESKINPDDSLFVFAKAAQGPPMPLAVSKHSVAEFPLKVSLNDSMAMMPELKLSSFDQIIISARVSKSGDPIAQQGDLQGISKMINPKLVDTVSITINEVVK